MRPGFVRAEPSAYSHLYQLPYLHTYGGCRFAPHDRTDAIPSLPSETLTIQRLAITDTQWFLPGPQAAAALARLALGRHLRELNLNGQVGHLVYAAIIDVVGASTLR